MERNQNVLDTPVTPLPNPGEGGPVYPGSDDNAQIPVIPLPNPGEGGPVYPGGFIQPVQPIQPLPTVTYAAVRFLNAAYGYPAFRVYVGNRRAARLLNFASLSAYVRLAAGYQTVTVTGTDGYIYIQKTIPFEAGGRFTIAVINRPGGLDLLRITDNCCFTSLQAAHFRVGNLARNSGALDVLLPTAAQSIPTCGLRKSPRLSASRPAHMSFSSLKPTSSPRPRIRISKRSIPCSSARTRFPIPPRRSICK